MDRDNLDRQTILVVEGEPLIALDLQAVLEGAGAEVLVARNAGEAVGRILQFTFSAAVVDWRPDSEDHRTTARALKKRNVRFLFYARHPPEDVTTVRGAPFLLKPAQPQEIIKALALLIGTGK